MESWGNRVREVGKEGSRDNREGVDDGGIEGELGKKVMRREKGAQGGWGRGGMTET